MCQQRAEYVVPCSTQSQCPDPWSAPLRCAHWMPILGDPGAHEMGVPSRNGDPREHNWEALPHPRQEPTPAETGPRPAPPGSAPPLPLSLRLPSRSGDPREHNWDQTPTHSHRNLDPRSPGLPRPGCAPGAFPAAVATSESTTGKPCPTPARSRPLPRAARVRPAPAALPVPSQPQRGPPSAQLRPPPTPSGPEPRPAPPGFDPHLSRHAAHLHRGLPVSPAPTPGSRRGSGYCRQFKHEDNTSTPQGQSKLSMI